MTHKCRGIKEFKICGTLIWATDGERWYPLKLTSPKNKHPKFTPEDGTEPKITIIDSEGERKGGSALLLLIL
ncbi:MAG: hypothetical protein WA421_08525 [Nitrososphaeraceae archaeon]